MSSFMTQGVCGTDIPLYRAIASCTPFIGPALMVGINEICFSSMNEVRTNRKILGNKVSMLGLRKGLLELDIASTVVVTLLSKDEEKNVKCEEIKQTFDPKIDSIQDEASQLMQECVSLDALRKKEFKKQNLYLKWGVASSLLTVATTVTVAALHIFKSKDAWIMYGASILTSASTGVACTYALYKTGWDA